MVTQIMKKYDIDDIEELDSEAYFVRKDGFKRTNPSDPVFKCPKCENVSKTKCELESHTKKHKKKCPNSTCDLCDDRFTSKKNLENHEIKYSK